MCFAHLRFCLGTLIPLKNSGKVGLGFAILAVSLKTANFGRKLQISSLDPFGADWQDF
jgi:hypothetical protein